MLAMHSIKNADDLDLQLESTLQEVPVWAVQIEIDRPGNELATLFEQEPLLPGIILTRNQQYQGMISRRIFFEQMSRPYGLGLFAGRPIESLYNFLQPKVFVFAEDTPIVEAAQVALERSPQLVYEPILVKTKSFKHGLVDFHQLLLAYSQIQVLTRAQLEKQEEKTRIARAGFRELQHNYTRLLQNEKMAALGQLVAGIAHEINNPISFIYGNLSYATQYVQDLVYLLQCYQQQYPNAYVAMQAEMKGIELDFIIEDLPKLLSSMMVGANRIHEIVLSLRNFSRLDEAEFKSVDIHEGIDNTLIILQNRLKYQPDRPEIKVFKEYGNLPLVECYAGQLNQVFMNILANAIDALSESYQLSVICFDFAPVTPKPLTIHIRTEVTDDNHIIIHIIDNGPGIPESIQKRLFDPFFTTKSVGKGTGLGLSISYQIIVEKHGGQLNCISTQGKGAEFIIKIPVRPESKNQQLLP
ncbi:ATP-binding protein [Cylindrospermum sp. FACHB-282]|uniref:ATP-binding protein n=1 Tax=Cylindrospermum sp. FACHB-282 TaxID=2692794 RepID=UPI0016890530|nr:ATP-binding protein [Cylindrospermum sp. FACHB-282]MBD2386368.1 ATPase [Cylindrospermum sp. FACHB-282]